MRLLPALALLALLAAGCGGAEEKEVKNAIGRFASATETEDPRTACRTLAPGSRAVLAQLADARYGRASCEALFAARFAQAGDGAFAIDQARLSALDEAEVEIDGDRAEVDTFGDEDPLPLERSEGQWRLDLLGIRTQAYALRASAACSAVDATELRAGLPPPTRTGYAAETRRAARRLDSTAARFARLDPPDRRAHDDLLAALRGQARELRRIAADVRGGGPVLDSVSRRSAALAQLQQRALAAQRRLGVACDTTAFREGAERYRRRADGICRTVSVRIDRLGRPEDAAALGPYMRRVRAAGATASRGLRRLRAPRGLGALHRRTVRAYDDALAEIPAIARADDPAAAYDDYGLRSLRASTGFTRLGLATCASL